MRERVRRIGHIGLAVSDLDASVRFYTEVVGLRLTERFVYPENEVGHGRTVSAGAFIRCDSTHHCISLFALKHGSAPGGPEHEETFGLHHLAFEMDSPEDLLAMYRRCKDAGVEIVNSRQGGPGNQPRFYARDPDENLVEFYWSIDQVGWDGIPREYPEIEEIDLEKFDFEAFVAERERAAKAAQEDNAASPAPVV